MHLYFFLSIVVAVLFLLTAINGNQVKSNKRIDQNIGRQLKRGRFLCQFSSSTTLYITFCYREKQLCDTSAGVARCICAKGWRGKGCQERIYEPPSILPTKMPTFSRIGGICTESIDCATINAGCSQGQCRCAPGFTPRKGNCININECEKGLRNECHRNADCTDTEGSYQCNCKEGFSDTNPNFPGRNCQQTNECTIGVHNCDEAIQVCVDRRPPEKWECIERTPSPTPKPTKKPSHPPIDEPSFPILKCADLSALKKFNIDENVELMKLTALDLKRKAITGSIPSEICALTALESLNLSDNALTGSIPSEIGALTALTHLSLSRNLLNGSIPSQIGTLTNLLYLFLSGNNLQGSLPDSLCGRSLTALIDSTIKGCN